MPHERVHDLLVLCTFHSASSCLLQTPSLVLPSLTAPLQLTVCAPRCRRYYASALQLSGGRSPRALYGATATSAALSGLKVLPHPGLNTVPLPFAIHC